MTIVYTFLDTNIDLINLGTPYTGDIDIIISGTGTTGINPDLLGDPFINSPASMLTNPDDAIRNTLTANVTSLAFLVDATFNGIVYSYSKDGIFYHVNMGPEVSFLWSTQFDWE
jgi:hypothetical protein